MIGARNLAKLSAAVVPVGEPWNQRVDDAQRAIVLLPIPIRWVFVVLVTIVWWAGALWHKSKAKDRHESAAQWVEALIESPVSLFYSLGQWLKATCCMIALAPAPVRNQLYTDKALETPVVVQPPTEMSAPVASAQAGDVADEADYIVVGTGPAGAMVASSLTQGGASVLMLEDGDNVPRQWAAKDTLEVLSKRFRSAAVGTTAGPARIPILQGRGVGGSSLVNSAIVWRAPEYVFADWHQDKGLAQALPLTRVERAYDAVEGAMRPEVTDAQVYGASNALMESASQKLGWAAEPTLRYTQGCEGLGRCMEGCPRGKKTAVNLNLIPQAVTRGARLHVNCRVQRVVFEGQRAIGVWAKLDGNRRFFRANKSVIVTASCVQTPLILRRSGISHRLLGARFQAHPGASMTGVFDSPIRGERLGAMQGYDVHEFRDKDSFKIETLSMPEELLASRLPGVGRELGGAIRDELPHSLVWGVQLRAKAHGRVGGSEDIPAATYRLTHEDHERLARAMVAMGELLFAAGAREVLPGIRGLPKRIRSMDALRGLEVLHSKRLNLILSHMFGTAVMGTDEGTSVCDPWGKVHGTENLYVADSSLFPTNLGVNPQHTIMAVAQHVAWGIEGDAA